MKKIWTTTWLLLLCAGLYALDASVSYATFHSKVGNYVEVYLHITGKTVSFTPRPDSTLQASVEVVLLFKKGEQIAGFDKFILNSPASDKPIDFIDLKRMALPDGDYTLEVSIRDSNRPENEKQYSTQVTVAYSGAGVLQSDIQLLASCKKDESEGPFVKNGLNMEPLAYNFYGRQANTLYFYSEIYQADQAIGEDFLVSYFVYQLENQEQKPVLIGHKRQKPEPVLPLLASLDISKLASGNYMLEVEVRNRDKGLLSKKNLLFQRSNPFLEQKEIDLSQVDMQEEFVASLSPKELTYSLRALTPHLPQNDVSLVNYMLKNDSINAQRMYLFSFWAKENPTNPAAAYRKYMEVADAVDKQFRSGFRYGFESDRGFFYLKYGQPNDIERRENEPSAPPYEIWSYNYIKATGQNNVRFVFYNPSLAGEDYMLLHSDVIGERNNPQWQLELYKNAPNEIQGRPFDATEMQDNFGRNAGRLFRDN